MTASERLRVLHVVFSLDAGGMENGIVNVSRSLEGHGCEFHVCCLARGGKFVKRFPNPERVHILGKREGFSPGAVRALATHIRRVAPDVIHSHNLGPLIYTALAAPGGNILHSEHAELTARELAPHRKYLRRLLYTRVNRVHTVSAALRESLVGLGFPARKISAVANGVDSTHFCPGSKAEARVQIGLPPDAIIFGLVGRFGEFKRHTELIEAFEGVPARKDLLVVFIGGGGPTEERIRQQAGASLCGQRIHFAGFQQDLRLWYRALDLLVIPSVNEGLSNALLEAMACGIPALAHRACGNAEVIEHLANGFLGNLSGPDALRSALIDVLHNRATLPSLGRAACVTIQSKFSLAAMVGGYERLYREVAVSHAG